MNIRDMVTLFDYNYWATARILDAGARLDPDQFRGDTAHSHGSLRGTLVHMLDAEYGWRMLCQHNASTPIIDEEAFPTIGALAERWREEEQAMRAYLATLRDEDLQRAMRDDAESDAGREKRLWHALLHVVNHGTQHRSEAAEILTRLGASPGDVDFILFLGAED